MSRNSLHELPTNNTNAKLLYPELSYLITGILFEIHNKLGNKYQEKHYQRAIAIKLKELKIPFEREAKLDAKFENEKLGIFFVDFIIDKKIVLETKQIWHVGAGDIKQVLRYLKESNLRLGIIANFRHDRLEIRRVVN